MCCLIDSLSYTREGRFNVIHKKHVEVTPLECLTFHA